MDLRVGLILADSRSMTITVRKAAPEDITWMIEQLGLFSSFYGTKYKLLGDVDHAREVLGNMIRDHVLLIAEREGNERVGLIGGLFSPHLFNPKILTLTETFWWVTPEHRGTRAGLMLLNEFTRIGQEIAHWVLFTLEHHSPVREQTLTKRGYNLQERNYILEVC